MLDAFKQLVESGVMTAETQTVIESALAAKLQENRDQVTAELREEFAQKYTHDKSVMVEAIDKMLSDRLAVEMSELYNDKKSLAEAKAHYQTRIAEDAKKLEGFVINQLTSNLVYPETFKRAIEAKNNAVQSALMAENKVKQAEAEAKIKVATAEGNAQAMLTSAKAEAEANSLKQKTITPMLLQLEYINKWDGKLPVYNGGGVIPFINIGQTNK